MARERATLLAFSLGLGMSLAPTTARADPIWMVKLAIAGAEAGLYARSGAQGERAVGLVYPLRVAGRPWNPIPM